MIEWLSALMKSANGKSFVKSFCAAAFGCRYIVSSEHDGALVKLLIRDPCHQTCSWTVHLSCAILIL